MEAVILFETLVITYKSTGRHNPDHNSKFNLHENLTSHKVFAQRRQS
jgi:hypothetical protein